MVEQNLTQEQVTEAFNVLGQNEDVYEALQIISNYDANEQSRVAEFLREYKEEHKENLLNVDPDNVPVECDMEVVTEPPQLILTSRKTGERVVMDVSKDNKYVQQKLEEEKAMAQAIGFLSNVVESSAVGFTASAVTPLIVAAAKKIIAVNDDESQQLPEETKSVIATFADALKGGFEKLYSYLQSSLANFSLTSLPWAEDATLADNLTPLDVGEKQVTKEKSAAIRRS